MMIPEGTWKIRAGESTLANTQEDGTGNTYVAVEIIVLEGPAEGSRLTWYGHLTDKTFDRTIESLRYLGWQGNDLSNLEGLGSADAMGVFQHEEYNGVLRSRVQWINAIGGVAVTNRLNPLAAKSFAEQMKGRVLALKQGSPAARTANANTNTPANNDDDQIPF